MSRFGQMVLLFLLASLIGAMSLDVRSEQVTVALESSSPVTTIGSDYRWCDIAGYEYSQDFQDSYDYVALEDDPGTPEDEATVHVAYETIGATFQGTLTASGLKPNFAYQVKLVGRPDDGTSPEIRQSNLSLGSVGRWWHNTETQRDWDHDGELETIGVFNLDNILGAGNVDAFIDEFYDVEYPYLKPFLLFAFFVTDEAGWAVVNFSLDSSYHVLWLEPPPSTTGHRNPGANDSPSHPLAGTVPGVGYVQRTIDPGPSDYGYDTDYDPIEKYLYAEWQAGRPLPGSAELSPGDYVLDFLLTEESFHGFGPEPGYWAAAMIAPVEFTISSGLVDLTVDGAAYAGEIAFAGEEDWYRFVAESAGEHVIETHQTPGEDAMDTVIYLYDETQTTLIASNDDGGEGRFSRIVRTLDAATYTVLVIEYGNNGTGHYSIDVVSTSGGGSEPPPPPSEMVDLTVDGAAYAGEIAFAGEEDWYRFVAESAGEHVIETHQTPGENVMDTVTYLYDETQTTLIASNDDGGEGRFSRIARTLDAGTYTVAVIEYGNNGTGHYSIDVVSTSGGGSEPPPPPSEMVDLTVNGSAYAGEIAFAGEEDWYRFVAESAGEYVVETHQTPGEDVMDTVIYLYDETQTTLIASNDDGGEGRFSRIARTLDAGTYTVKVIEYGNNGTGHYRIDVVSTSGSGSEPPPPPSEMVDLTVDGAAYAGEIAFAGEEDWYRFVADSAGEYVIETHQTPGEDAMDTVIYLYDATQTTQIASNDDGGEGRFSRIARTLDPGTYTVKIIEYGNNGTGHYSVDVVSSSGGGTEPPPEPSEMVDLTVDGAAYAGEIAFAGEEDWYRFVAESSGEHVIETHQTPGENVMDTVMYLYDATQTTLLASNDDGGEGRFSRIARTLDAGMYTVLVIEYGNNGTGHYDIDVVTESGGGPEPPPPEPSEMVDLTVDGAAYAGEIAFAGEEDWYRFVADSAGEYVIETHQTPGENAMDTVMYLYDATQTTLLASNDDGGEGRFSRIARTLDAGTYTVKVIEYGNNGTGHYSIDVVGESGGEPPVSGPSISNVTFSDSGALHDIVEISFNSSNDPYSNPFDPAVVDATVTVTPPSGNPVTLVAFWYQEYSASGGDTGWEVYTPEANPKWMARFAPKEIGTHTFTIAIQDSEGTGSATDPLYQFNVVDSNTSGFLARHPTNNKYILFSNGEPYLPIGHNVAFREGSPTSSKDGTALWEEYYARMEENGENWSRFWMTDFDRMALEWQTGHWGSSPDNFDYQGLGRYSLKAAWRVDQKLASAQSHGIYVQLVLHDHGQFSTHVNARWNGSSSPNDAYKNPYNSAAGGPVSDPNDFFSNTSCRDLTRQRVRYIIARYGAFRSVLAWELWNEVQFTGNSFDDSFRTAYDDPGLQSAVETWHADMASYLKNNDPHQHLVTTSSEDDWKALYPNWTNLNGVWNDPNIDLIQIHHYRNTAWSGGLEVYDRDQAVADMIASLRSTYDKPVWCGEFGVGDQSKAGGGYEHPDACWTLDGYDPVNSSSLFDPTLAADHRDDHLDQGTHLHNLLWMALVNESLSAYWWWGRYIHEDSSKNRTAATGFPLYYHYKVARAFLDAANANSWPELSLSTVQATASPELRVFGSQASEHAYLFVRDVDNGFGTGSEPGDIGVRTLTGMTITLSGMSPGTEVDVMYCDTWDEQTPLGVIASEQVIASPDGFLTLHLPPFQRDVAVIVAPAPG